MFGAFDVTLTFVHLPTYRARYDFTRAAVQCLGAWRAWLAPSTA